MSLARFFDFRGRIGRGEFWLAAVKAALICFVAGLLFMWLGWTSTRVESGTIQYDGGGTSTFYNQTVSPNPFAALVLWALWLVCLLPASIRRSHDRGSQGRDVMALSVIGVLLALTDFSPVMGPVSFVLGLISSLGAVYLMVVLGFLPGTPGANAFGPDPRAEALASIDSTTAPPSTHN